MPRHTARGIVIQADQLLLIERWRADKHYFSIPGGGIEASETPEQTVLREIAEETGCTVGLMRKLYVLRLPDGTQHHIFLCRYLSGTAHLPADSPEALERDPQNRFEPAWIPLEGLAARPFMVWQPVKDRLLHDLENGFDENVVELVPDMVP